VSALTSFLLHFPLFSDALLYRICGPLNWWVLGSAGRLNIGDDLLGVRQTAAQIKNMHTVATEYEQTQK